MQRIVPGELKVGDALPWNLYDESRQLLLALGTIVGSVRQIDSLLLRGACRLDAAPGEPASATALPALAPMPATPFEQLDRLIGDVSALFVQVEERASTAARCCHGILARFEELCANAPDAMLGAVHLVHEHPYTVVHPVHAAIVADLMCDTRDYAPARRRSVLLAALLQNIGMRQVQQELVRHAGRPTVMQRSLIREHPGRSVAMMRAAAIDDPLAEKIVLQHHETADGTGYPAGIGAAELCEEAAIVSLADRYCALISARSYRQALSAGDSLRSLYMNGGTPDEGKLVQQFIQATGIYPPGAFVTLNNGEGGIVVKRGVRRTEPVVRAYISPRGGPYQQFFTRDCAAPGLRITGTTQPDPTVSLNLSRVWGFRD